MLHSSETRYVLVLCGGMVREQTGSKPPYKEEEWTRRALLRIARYLVDVWYFTGTNGETYKLDNVLKLRMLAHRESNEDD